MRGSYYLMGTESTWDDVPKVLEVDGRDGCPTVTGGVSFSFICWCLLYKSGVITLAGWLVLL